MWSIARIFNYLPIAYRLWGFKMNYETRVAINYTAQTIEINQNINHLNSVTSSNMSFTYAECEKLIRELRNAQYALTDSRKVTLQKVGG